MVFLSIEGICRSVFEDFYVFKCHDTCFKTYKLILFYMTLSSVEGIIKFFFARQDLDFLSEDLNDQPLHLALSVTKIGS